MALSGFFAKGDVAQGNFNRELGQRALEARQTHERGMRGLDLEERTIKGAEAGAASEAISDLVTNTLKEVGVAVPRLAQQDAQRLHHGGRGGPARFRAVFILAVGKHPVDRGLCAGPVHFQVAHEEDCFPPMLQKNKGVGRKEFRGEIEI